MPNDALIKTLLSRFLSGATNFARPAIDDIPMVRLAGELGQGAGNFARPLANIPGARLAEGLMQPTLPTLPPSPPKNMAAPLDPSGKLIQK